MEIHNNAIHQTNSKLTSTSSIERSKHRSRDWGRQRSLLINCVLAQVVNFFSFKVRSLNATCKYRSVRMKRTKTKKKKNRQFWKERSKSLQRHWAARCRDEEEMAMEGVLWGLGELSWLEYVKREGRIRVPALGRRCQVELQKFWGRRPVESMDLFG